MPTEPTPAADRIMPSARTPRDIRRRTVLFGSIGLLSGAILTGGGALTGVLPGESFLRRNLGLTGPRGSIPAVDPGSVRLLTQFSQARNRSVRLLVSIPRPSTGGPLPVCLALHGRSGSAQDMADLGLAQFAADAVAHGVAPFAAVAVDGGDDTYWHARHGDDPMAMLLDELPGWLSALGLTAAPRSVLGISMGGSGALRYTKLRAQRADPVAATAVLSPALFATWPDAVGTGAFTDEPDWARTEPLLDPAALHHSRLGVWCGTADVFLDNARQLAAAVPATAAEFSPGAHNPDYWRRVLPPALRFLGQ